MKIGLLADIHEHLEHLMSALRIFERHQVDRIVVLGDICATGARLRETVMPLIACNAIGVWGNHELGLCHEPDPELTSRFDDAAIKYLATLKPSLEMSGMPDWDATDPTAYYTREAPWDALKASAVFSSHPHWLFLMGHFHRWFGANEQGRQTWDFQKTTELAERHLVVVNPVFKGSCAVLDTHDRLLTAFNFG